MARTPFTVSPVALWRLKRYFSAACRTRGIAYAASGRVHLAEANDSWVGATVRGQRVYDVELDDRKGRANATCSCPYFADEATPCKHIWATLIVAETTGALPWLRESRGMTFERVDEGVSNGSVAPRAAVKREADSAPRRALRSASRARPARPGHGHGHGHGHPQAQLAPAVSWRQVAGPTEDTAQPAPPRDELRYVIASGITRASGRLHVRLMRRAPTATPSGSSGWREASVPESLPGAVGAPDALLIGMLGALSPAYGYRRTSSFDVPSEACREVVERLCASGRAHLETADGAPLRWDAAPYTVSLSLAPRERGAGLEVRTALARGDERVPAAELSMVMLGGLSFWPDRVAPVDDGGALRWMIQERSGGAAAVPLGEVYEFVDACHAGAPTTSVALPPEFALQEVAAPGTPYVLLTKGELAGRGDPGGLGVEAGMDYDGARASLQTRGRGVLDLARRRLLLRDHAAEDAAREQLTAAGARPIVYWSFERSGDVAAYRLAASRLDAATRELVAAGWRVEVDGKPRRKGGDFAIDVTSGIDWLDVRVSARFDGVEAPLPELLAALRQRRSTVTLADGSVGQLPDEWVDKLRRWTSMAQPHADALRFSKVQTALVAALVDREERASVDAGFSAWRKTLDSFAGVKPVGAPRSFKGTLRDYQRYSQGWFAALRQLGFGGCLADDMGLGKTVQVLAMLERRRAGKPAPGPSLVVAPRSVVFNWVDEAARFAPGLKVLVHGGAERLAPGDHLREYHLVLATYGVLRRDAAALSGIEFDYVILDEAQAIKTAKTATAKAARMLRSRHRLALTGTPLENHLGEVGSLLDFLNPGVLGVSGLAALGTGGRSVDDTTREILARAVKPFFLRRTKRQVASELPDRIEQTLSCELEGEQLRHYKQLHAHYQASLARRVARDGMGKSTAHILEALLRLRQAACHPGLIDPGRRAEPSAKLDVLLEHLAELREQGQKALVFSQFTSLLGIVRDRLDARGIAYAYLDGATVDRAACVARFQTDPACGLFLISLKAGGLGLNLTAAEYVFLLDPWWNPAVEAQAIDRAHRIGQTRTVCAYRLIARGTVEEKVAELQNKKRALAEALFGGEGASLGGLTRADLEALLA